MQFRKYQGTGNDFILLDNRGKDIILTPEEIRRLCNRRLGIGADGLILLNSSESYDFEMVYYNSDGSSDAMCGNGGRCIVAFAYHLDIISDTCSFKAYDGPHHAVIVSREAHKTVVKMSMKNCSVPLHFTENEFFLDTGAPHFIIFSRDIKNLDVAKHGLKRSYDDRLPCRSNVNFVAIDGDSLLIRTFERGVEDETLSCGTGITAAALTYANAFLPDKHSGKIKISAAGGDLNLYFNKTEEHFQDIWLEGETEFIFSGTIL